MQVYFARHGETNFNRLRLCNDDPRRDVHLTPTGIAQAERLGRALATTPLERIFVSELPRTRQTAEIVNRHHDVPVETVATLNDIRSGYDGQPVEHYMNGIAADPLHARVGDGETLLEHKARVLGFLDHLRRLSCSMALVIAHEETLRVFRARALGLGDREMIGLSFANCEYFPFRLDDA